MILFRPRIGIDWQVKSKTRKRRQITHGNDENISTNFLADFSIVVDNIYGEWKSRWKRLLPEPKLKKWI